MKKIIILLVLIFFGFVSGSYAAIIDFRSGDFSSADGSSSFSYAPAGLTITASPDGAVLYQDSIDGLGVRYSYENDEIEGDECLHLSFNTSQFLYEILITDLFYEPYNYGGGSFLEEGQYSFDQNVWIDFEADSTQTPSTNGELTLLFASPTVIDDIWFRAAGWENCFREDHEFSVARIDVGSVPEPATMLLLGTGLVGLVGFRKKLKK